ncbi:MAG: HupE/UreJ family protein [Myxococcota bacterium]
MEQRLELRDEDGPRPLQGLLINSSTEHDNAGSIDQLVLMGRFALASPEGTVWLHTDLFGEEEHERSLQIKATREDQVQLVVLTPDRNDAAIFPDRRHVLFEYVELGIDHILTGFDHVLLLLLVLATGWGWRRVTVALTCFTLGHAVTLVASVTGTVELSPALVEPAIAATLFGMAVFDWMAENRRWAIANQWRMVLVFACALVHGLGLASSLNELGLRDAHQLHSLVGFNVGIEIGQLLIATVAMLVLEVVRRVGGRAVYALALKIVSFVAVVMGAAWFVERVVM